MIFFMGLNKIFQVKASHVGGKLGVDAQTNLNQTDKKTIGNYKTLPRGVSEAAVHKMEYNAAKEKRRAELRAMYSKHLKVFLEAKKQNYKIDADYQTWFMNLVDELCKIDADFEKAVSRYDFDRKSTHAELSGYQAACNGASSFRP